MWGGVAAAAAAAGIISGGGGETVGGLGIATEYWFDQSVNEVVPRC